MTDVKRAGAAVALLLALTGCQQQASGSMAPLSPSPSPSASAGAASPSAPGDRYGLSGERHQLPPSPPAVAPG
ncbi:hypothetical protein C7C46_27460, partial [Streptomyces tateyamensis]